MAEGTAERTATGEGSCHQGRGSLGSPGSRRSRSRDHDQVAAEIGESVDEIAGFLNAQHARLVDQVVTLLADTRLWQGSGVWTMAQWLAWRTGISPRTARHVVAIAERVDELPACATKFRRGELSLEQMAAIAERAPSWTDDQMSGLGVNLTVSQIRRTLGRYPFPTDDPVAPDQIGGDERPADEERSDDTGADANEACEGACEGADGNTGPNPDDHATGATTAPARPDEYCSLLWGDDGMLRLSARCDDETGRIIEAALAEARDRLFRDGGREVSWLEALREAAERSLDTVGDPGRRTRFQISVFVETDGTMVDASRSHIGDAFRARLGCDRSMTPVFLHGGRPVSVGRSQRIVPERTRRQVEYRDHHACRVPGCTSTRFLEVHHIVHWLEGGPTDMPNLLCICPHHHRLHHRGRLGIEGNADDPDGVRFTNEHGRRIAETGARPIPPAGAPPPPLGSYRHPTGERLDTRWLEFREPPARQPSTHVT